MKSLFQKWAASTKGSELETIFFFWCLTSFLCSRVYAYNLNLLILRVLEQFAFYLGPWTYVQDNYVALSSTHTVISQKIESIQNYAWITDMFNNSLNTSENN